MIWIDLPFLIQGSQKWWVENSVSMTKFQRRNLSAFMARLASLGVCGHALFGCASMLFREAFEVPRKLVSADNEDEIPFEDFLPAICSWLAFAIHKWSFLVETSFNEFEDAEVAVVGEMARNEGVTEPGINALRWAFWKKNMIWICQSKKVEGADDILQMMKEVDRSQEIDV